MDNIDIKPGQKVLLVWGGQSSENIQDIVQSLTNQVGESGSIHVEHVERLTQCMLLVCVLSVCQNNNLIQIIVVTLKFGDS